MELDLEKTGAQQGSPLPEELEQINRYTRRKFGAEELYAFTVVLCDNEIDRDFERFSIPALTRLAELFPGKTGIFNHAMQAQNQSARIFSCRVEQTPGRKTKAGEDYRRLVARAYLPRCQKNGDFILELESGMKKEVSVGCAVAESLCSVCGADRKKTGCRHKNGQVYGGKLCHTVLNEPTDAYEWSFVAVPAQREAGVIKSYRGKEKTMEDVTKALREAQETVTLTKEECQSLLARLEGLEDEAACGRQYREGLRQSVKRYAMLAQPELPAPVWDRATEHLETGDLQQMEKVFRQKAEQALPLTPQLAPAGQPGAGAQRNDAFKI